MPMVRDENWEGGAMNFWTFLDRNSEGLWLLSAVLIFAVSMTTCMGKCGDGCSVHIGDKPAPAADGGAK